VELKFDADQEFQIAAVQSVADLFAGQPRLEPVIEFRPGTLTLAAIANRLQLPESVMLENLHVVQDRNDISRDQDLVLIEGQLESEDGARRVRFPNFSVEMETGTGKTYVYIRTIFELFKRYGFRKYIVVVPSVAVREGVRKTLQITEDHFKRLYANLPYRFYEYDSSDLTHVRQFALSDSIEIMVMTIDAFNKAQNVIRQSRDRLNGEIPIEMIQESRPILILDEPQNMESETSIASLCMLNPLFALRYSATHRNPYNIVYRLTPAGAYEQHLVKRIEVHSVLQEGELATPYIKVSEIISGKRVVTAKLIVHKLLATGQIKEATVTVKPGDSLAAKTGRPDYDGWGIREISPGGRFVMFDNERELRFGEEQGADRRAIFSAQIRHTIEQHLKKQQRLRDKGIKVLSLFFIDRVANYVGEDGRPGMIVELFDRAFADLSKHLPEWEGLSAPEVRAAYFAEKRKRDGEIEMLDSSSGEAKEDVVAYDLIMRDKESLLSFPDPGDDAQTKAKKRVCFIFSHSALREGWDNPNVFQLCTMNQTASNMKKRQEVGRGVRLAVDQSGIRVRDEAVNILTVVANESYRRYVETLQSEIAYEYRAEIESRYGKPIGDLSEDERRRIEEEYGQGILPPPPRKSGSRPAKLRKARALSPQFEALWDRIKDRTRFAVTVNSDNLVMKVLPELDLLSVQPPRVTVVASDVGVVEGEFVARQTGAARTVEVLDRDGPLPNVVDLIGELMTNANPPVRLTRSTLNRMVAGITDKSKLMVNPLEWATRAASKIRDSVADELVEGIAYFKTGEWYEMKRILEDEDIELFCRFVGQPDPAKNKTIYDLIPCDSGVEAKFVNELEARADVHLYVKLPLWFTVPTPVGEYRPDWAIVMDDPDGNGKPVLYLVAETKAHLEKRALRTDEWRKIECGAAHFGSKQFGKTGALSDVLYVAVKDASALPYPPRP
jgi:type III restriction enzyme